MDMEVRDGLSRSWAVVDPDVVAVRLVGVIQLAFRGLEQT
jgi:hypothetical protein